MEIHKNCFKAIQVILIHLIIIIVITVKQS
jgi:hypothetical protein